jgi:Cof subfamily protein (haloacid dehalogenase superfamily)
MRVNSHTHYAVLALDLDGTVVDHTLTVSPAVQHRLQWLQTHTDCKVVIATGRMSLSAARFAQQLGVNTPVISYQGAMIKNAEGERLYHQPLPLEAAKSLVTYLSQQNIAVNLYIDDQLYMHTSNPFQESYAKLGGATPVLVNDLTAALTAPPTKLLIIDDHRVQEVIEHVEKHYPGVLTPCQSRHNFCEVIAANVSKWAGIQWLIEQWDIAPELVMAIGDQGNDVSMLQAAGLGVAMGNAPDFVKTVAKAVTTPIEGHGVAVAIDTHLLAAPIPADMLPADVALSTLLNPMLNPMQTPMPNAMLTNTCPG